MDLCWQRFNKSSILGNLCFRHNIFEFVWVHWVLIFLKKMVWKRLPNMSKSVSRVWLFVSLWTVTSVHGILQARILEWIASPSSRGSSRPRAVCLTVSPNLKFLHFYWVFPGGSESKESPAMGENWVQSLGWEDPLEKGMGTHSSILIWRIPWLEEPGRLQSMG